MKGREEEEVREKIEQPEQDQTERKQPGVGKFTCQLWQLLRLRLKPRPDAPFQWG